MTTIKEWTYKGKRCKIIQDSDLGHYCGYVQTGLRGNITINAELWRLIEVHGGINYGIDEEGWIGFDCAHINDICVDENGEVTSDYFKNREDEDSIIWSPEDVEEEVEKFAEQIIALEKTVHEAERSEQ